jgi:hypothetical protein
MEERSKSYSGVSSSRGCDGSRASKRQVGRNGKPTVIDISDYDDD